MKKGQIMALFLAFIMSLSSLTLFNVQASERQKPHYDDAYGLLTNTEANELSGYLEKISEKRRCDVSIAIVNAFSGSDIEMYAHDFYDNYVLLLHFEDLILHYDVRLLLLLLPFSRY